MALFRDEKHVLKGKGDAFDKVYTPGIKVPHSGIYRCENCGDEVASNKDDPFPPQNHHQHSPPAPILWRLLVFAQQKD